MATELRRLALRRGTAAEWTAANTLLAVGEEGYETDTGRRKIGDGVTTWNSLSYQPSDIKPVRWVESDVEADALPADTLAIVLEPLP